MWLIKLYFAAVATSVVISFSCKVGGSLLGISCMVLVRRLKTNKRGSVYFVFNIVVQSTCLNRMTKRQKQAINFQKYNENKKLRHKYFFKNTNTIDIFPFI